LREGDRITALGGERLNWWGDLEEEVRARAGKTVSVGYERDGVAATTRLAISSRASTDEFGQKVEVGTAGFEHYRLAAILGVAAADTPAHAAGLRSGELVEAVNGKPVESWSDFAAIYAAAGTRGQVELSLRRSEASALPAGEAEPSEARTGDEAVHRTVVVPALGRVEALGVLPATVLVSTVTEGSAADQGGLRPGDLIVSVDEKPVGSFGSFAELVRTSGGRPLTIQFARDGELHTATIAPKLEEYDAGFGLKEPRYLVGITAEVASLQGELGVDRERNPLVAVPRAVEMTVDVTRTFIQGLVKLATGEVSRKQLAGPIGIAEIAGHAYERGWETYLSILVLISINLGILNLLPIPVLDGGQAVIYAVEGIRRAPLSLRTREIVQQVGFTVLMLLMGLAFWNDLSRQWTRLLDWFSGA
jgi:regulator of sigma E protease